MHDPLVPMQQGLQATVPALAHLDEQQEQNREAREACQKKLQGESLASL